MPRKHHVAQINVALMRGPIDSPVMQGFVAQLEFINAVADRAPGFVWRLQDEAGDATSIRAFDDPRILVNLTVWESIEALHHYIYRSAHAGPFRDRANWFLRMDRPAMALWWVPAGHLPTREEGEKRLEKLRRDGPTPEAFTFRQRFPAPGAEASGKLDLCDWAP